jgi:hypothetical protein
LRLDRLGAQAIDHARRHTGRQQAGVLRQDARLHRQEVAALARPFAQDVMTAAAEMPVLAGDLPQVMERRALRETNQEVPVLEERQAGVERADLARSSRSKSRV